MTFKDLQKVIESQSQYGLQDQATTNGIVVQLLQEIKNKEDVESEDNGRSENSERDLEEQQQTHNGIF